MRANRFSKPSERIPATLIVTGFEPFGGAPTNPSGGIARSLNGHTAGSWNLRGVELPVSAPAAWDRLRRSIRAARARAVIALGVAADREEICVECVARNFADYVIPDNCGRQPRGERIHARAPDTLAARTGAESILTSLRSCGLPARLSTDAGLYVCNDFYFRLLRFAAHATAGLQHAVFIHIPAETMLAPELVREGIMAVVRGLPPARG